MEHVEHIILIDDNEVTNFYNQDLLSSIDPSWKITAFNTADQALAYFKANANARIRALVFLDIRMPEYTGFDLLRELEDLDLVDDADLTFCMLTSSSQVRDKEELTKFPLVQRYIEKPLSVEKVQRVLEQITLKK